MLTKDARQRLGAKGVHEIKNHNFFRVHSFHASKHTIFYSQGIDWVALEQRKLSPPIQPKVNHVFDLHNFAEEFTKNAPVYSPVDSSPNDRARELFRVR